MLPGLGRILTAASQDGVKRTMKQRHITMFAFAGTLGTGLFLSSGRAIVNAGPVGALICYLLVGSLIWSEMQCLGEMICFAPVSGGYVHFASRFVHPSLGFAFGWMKFYADLVSYPGEIVSASLIIGFWFDPFPVGIQVGFYTVFLAITIGINLCGARVYGEAEFWFAIIKIMLIIGLIIGGIVIDLGGGPNGDRIGFRYWVNPGPFSTCEFVYDFDLTCEVDADLARLDLVTGAAGRFAGMCVYISPLLDIKANIARAASSPCSRPRTPIAVLRPLLWPQRSWKTQDRLSLRLFDGFFGALPSFTSSASSSLACWCHLLTARCSLLPAMLPLVPLSGRLNGLESRSSLLWSTWASSRRLCLQLNRTTIPPLAFSTDSLSVVKHHASSRESRNEAYP